MRYLTSIILAPKGGKEIFKEKITEIVAESKTKQTRKDKKRVIRKIKKEERLSRDEFWNVYNLIHKNGPAVKYTTPNNWNKYIE